MTQEERKAAGLWPESGAWKKELGLNWVIARRTKRIVEQYGEDVRCLSPKEYEAARLRAWAEVRS